MTLLRLVRESHVLVVCGSGGVGKTTTSAALALEGARRGRRAVVITIDPARRLANALGLGTLGGEAGGGSAGGSTADGNEPGMIPPSVWDRERRAPEGASFAAMMLDTKTTFDDLVGQYATSPAQEQRILNNRFYQNISGALSGTQEYMAMEKLFELDEAGMYDLIVVDTPPSRHALDFLDAPSRLTAFLDARVFRWFLAPTRAGMRMVSSAARGFLRLVARTVGAQVLDDAVEFFAAFEGMYEGFRQRARKVSALIEDPRTAFVLVSSPRRDAVEEAEYFSERLGESGLSIEALVINRIHPRFSDLSAAAARAHGAALPLTNDASTSLAALYENIAEFNDVADREAKNLGGLAERLAPASITLVPFLERDVADVGGLDEVATYLFSASSCASAAS
jgi:anion-transporting  ArsA/GET3 family ATPase